MCLHPSGQTSPSPHQQHHLPHTIGSDGGGVYHRPAAVLLFTAPDRGPRCADGQQQQFEQCQSPVGPSTCKSSLIYKMMVCLHICKHKKKKKISINLSNQICQDCRQYKNRIALSAFCLHINQKPSITWHRSYFPSGKQQHFGALLPSATIKHCIEYAVVHIHLSSKWYIYIYLFPWTYHGHSLKIKKWTLLLLKHVSTSTYLHHTCEINKTKIGLQMTQWLRDIIQFHQLHSSFTMYCHSRIKEVHILNSNTNLK